MEGKIIGLGEILWDMLPTGKQLGGAPANFAYHVCHLGGNGWAVSAISDDELGREIKNTLSTKKLNTILEEVNEPTGTVQVTLNAAGVPTYDITEGVAWDHIPFTERIGDLAKETSAVCFGTLAQRSPESRATIHEFIENMPDGSLKVYDINLRQNYYDEKIISDSLRLADILKINDEELEIVSKMFCLSGTSEERCRAISREFNLKFVILTMGGDGSKVILEDRVHLSTPGKINIVDTVGAGDSFTAAFMLAYLRGESIEKAHTLATEVSSYVCTKAGAMPE